jgi:hypothetical protein
MIIKISEVWKNRFRIEVGYMFRSLAELGNDVIIRNLSSEPIIVDYWEVQEAWGMWPFRRFETIVSPEDSLYDIQIASHSSKKFNFSEADHFGWRNTSRKSRKLYFHFSIAGKGYITKRIG